MNPVLDYLLTDCTRLNDDFVHDHVEYKLLHRYACGIDLNAATFINRTSIGAIDGKVVTYLLSFYDGEAKSCNSVVFRLEHLATLSLYHTLYVLCHRSIKTKGNKTIDVSLGKHYGVVRSAFVECKFL